MEWHIVTGSKGGVGKTLLSLLLLAHNLKEKKREEGSTLILDLNGMNADPSALVLYRVGPEKRAMIKLETQQQLYLQNAEDLVFCEAHVDDEENLPQRYIVGWPANPFLLMNPGLFADLLKTITLKVSTIEKALGFESFPLRHVIIDTNYHFCNLFAQDRGYYTSYLPGGTLQGEQIHIWFLWVYRQFEKIRKQSSSHSNEGQIINQTATAIETYLKREDPVPAPLIHVFGPAGLITSPAQEGILHRLLTKKERDNYFIPEFVELEQLDTGPAVNFEKWIESLKGSYNQVIEKRNEKDWAALFPEVLVNAVSRVFPHNPCRPRNVIPLSVYHSALEHYTDKDRTNAVARLRKLPLYKDHLSKLLDQL